MSKAERTKQFIIEKTAPIFNKKGFYGTSMSDITEATGLTKGSIYGNFRNKDELAVEAYRYNYHQLTEQIRSEVSSRNSAIQKLLAFTDFYRHEYVRVFERGGCALLNTGTDADDNHGLLKEEVKGSLLRWKKLLDEIIVEGIEKGELREEKNFSEFFIALIEGSIFLAKTAGRTDYLLKNLSRLEREIENLGT